MGLQVSHHPPVTALHATDKEENIEMIWCQNPVPKFYGILNSYYNKGTTISTIYKPNPFSYYTVSNI